MAGFRKLKKVFSDPLPANATNGTKPSPHVAEHPPLLVPYWVANFQIGGHVSREWRHETGDHGWGNKESQMYTDAEANSFFRPGPFGRPCLVLRAVVDGDSVTSARLTSRNTLGRDSGYLCARITAPSAKGVWPAFWMLPAEPYSWPTDGEVDIMESWNDNKVNHSCFHWGAYTAEDSQKHRVVQMQTPRLNHAEGQSYGFAWNQHKGKMVWYLDGEPVMQADIPKGARRMADFQPKFNIAIGGTVNGGKRPTDGVYEMEVHEVGMFENPPGGWETFNKDAKVAPKGHTID